MFLVSSQRTINEASSCIERFLRHPRFVLGFFLFFLFFLFFFLHQDVNAATGFHEDQVNSVPEAATLTNDTCSLELSCGRSEESLL